MHLIDEDAVHKAWSKRLGGDPRADEHALAELVRAEVTARGTVRRASLLAAVGMFLGDTDGAHAERAADLLERLEQVGDVVYGRAGVVAAAPLRVVRRGGGRYLIIGAQPTRELERALAVGGVAAGMPRTVALSAEATEAFERGAASIGAVLSADEWAGLERVPFGREWLEVLEDGCDDPLEGAAPIDWSQRQAYLADPSEAVEARRWVRDPDAKLVGLVRAWREDRRPVYGWVRADRPESVRRLTRDEGLRTRFALDLTRNAGLTLHARHGGDGISLACGVWLPRAEYRYLACVAEAVERTATGVSVRCAHDTWPDVARMLSHRLGLRATFAGGVPGAEREPGAKIG